MPGLTLEGRSDGSDSAARQRPAASGGTAATTAGAGADKGTAYLERVV